MLETRTAIEREVRADSGQFYSRRVLPYWTAEHQLEGVVITFIDLTDRKRAADLVDDARIYAESIVAAVREPLVVLNSSLRVRSANPSFFEAFGLHPDEAVDRPIFSLGTGELDVPPLRRLLEEMLEHSPRSSTSKLTLPSQRSGRRTMLLNARMIPSLGEQSSTILLAIEDITDRKRAEQELKALNQTLEDRVSRRTAEAESCAEDLARSEHALRASEARLRTIVTTAADAIVTIDENGVIESCNPAAERMFDYPAGAIIGQKIDVLIPRSDFDADRDGLTRFLSTEQGPVPTHGHEVIGRRRDGSTLPLDLALSELHDGSRRLFTGIIRDISERRSLQQELLSIADAEQRRIGQDLHDDIGQELTGLGMKAETLCEMVTDRQIPERDLAADIVVALDRTRARSGRFPAAWSPSKSIPAVSPPPSTN